MTMQECHEHVTGKSMEDVDLMGMGTTLTMGWFIHNEVHMIHIGDSRIYRFRDNHLHQFSHDHSPVGEMYRNGLLSDESARLHPKRNLIDQALGGGLPDIEPQHASFAIQGGDIILLCTDGMSDAIPSPQIADILSQSTPKNLKEVADNLVYEANEQDGSDNISAILIYVIEN